MLWRQGPYFTGGHAFAAAFFGVGCGSGLGVILQMVAPGMDKAGLHEYSEQVLEEARRQGQSLPVSEAEFREAVEGMCLAAPIPMALVGTVVAGFVGMLTLSLLMRRRPQDYSQPPTQPPPPEPPVNPYSNQQA